MVIHRFQPLYQMASSSTHDFFFQEANTLSFVHSLNIKGVTSLGRHTRPACTQGFTRSLKLCEECGFNSCVRVFFILWGHVNFYAQIWANVTSISHMGEMRDSDWSREILLCSDWLPPIVAICTTEDATTISNDTIFVSPTRTTEKTTTISISFLQRTRKEYYHRAWLMSKSVITPSYTEF